MPDLFTIKPEPIEDPDEQVIRTEILLGKTLRIGVLGAAAALIAGTLLFLLRERHDISFDEALGRRQAITALTPRALWHGLRAGSARSVIMLGVLLLILTPIVRVATTVLLFLRQRDWIFVACAGFVLIILVLGLVGVGL